MGATEDGAASESSRRGEKVRLLETQAPHRALTADLALVRGNQDAAPEGWGVHSRAEGVRGCSARG